MMSEPIKKMSEGQSQKTKWYYTLWGVFLLIFLLGPFAFPWLWKSPRFNTFFKILITVVTVALTIQVTISSIEMAKAVYERLSVLTT